MGARFSAPVQTGPGAHPAFYTRGTGSFPGVKQLGPRLKKEQSYTCTPSMGLRGLFWGELYPYFALPYKSEEFSQILCLSLWLERTLG